MSKLTTISVIVVVLLSVGPGLREAQAGDMSQYFVRELAVGDWLVDLLALSRSVQYEGELTSMSFSPASRELAYSTVTETGASTLWLLPVPEFADLPRASWEGGPSTWALDPPRRPLWAPPASHQISGPIWWSPDGSTLATLTRLAEATELVCVDRLSGETRTVLPIGPVADLAWAPAGQRFAYTVDSNSAREVWLHEATAGKSRRLGSGGFNLRWDLEGRLSWLHPKSEDAWVEMMWDPATDLVGETNVVPPRAPGTVWSPDGTLCASLVPKTEGENAVAIFPTYSTAPDTVELPGADAQRLLGWSRDSRFVLVLTGRDNLLAVSAKPAGPAVLQTSVVEGRGGEYDRTVARATALSWMGLPDVQVVDPDVAPTWSGDGEYYAYVSAGLEDVKRRFPDWPAESCPQGRLLIVKTHSTYVEVPDEVQARKALALRNVMKVSLGLMMYLSDSDGHFPPVSEAEGLASLLEGYVGREVFTDPDTEDDEIVVSYVLPASLDWRSVGDTTATPAVIGDYDPNFIVIGYCDGHGASFPGTPDWEAKLREWQENLARLRAEDPQAIPPPFP